MYRTFLFAKIHRATVTAANVHYVGSITIDCELLQASGIRPTARPGGGRRQRRAAGDLCDRRPGRQRRHRTQRRGPRLVSIGDKVIIMAYAMVAEPLPESWSPVVLIMDEGNRVAEVRHVENPSEMCC